MKKPILTIGIPTYNRPKSIVKTVKSLLPQLNDKVVLLVKDNCSDIPVSSLFTNEEKKLFTIKRNKTNIGGDANICSIIYDADTKWVWDLGDDDYPLPDAVEKVLGYIENYPDEILFKFNSYIEKEIHSFEELADINKYRSVFSNFLFMSSSIFNRDKLIDYLQYYYNNISSMVGQTIFVLKYMEENSGNIYFLSNKIVEYSVDFLQPQGCHIIESGGWTNDVFIKRSSMIYDIFNPEKKLLCSTLFKGVAQQHLRGVLLNNQLSTHKKILMVCYILNKVGIYQIIKYNSAIFFQFFLYLVLPHKLYVRIKNKAITTVLDKNLNKNTI
jgi:glycosyltransferase involved in cell wall biosynthesis